MISSRQSSEHCSFTPDIHIEDSFIYRNAYCEHTEIVNSIILIKYEFTKIFNSINRMVLISSLRRRDVFENYILSFLSW